MWTVEGILGHTKKVGECLEWTRCFNTDGYPRIFPNIKVHRLLYELLHGEDLTGKVVRHSCDNIRCLNPEHLQSGTFADNNRDRSLRGRSYRTIKEEHVKLVKNFDESVKTRDIAEILGIDRRRVSEIRRGKRDESGRLYK